MSVSNQKHPKKAPYKGPYFSKHQYDLMRSLWQMGLKAEDHCKLFTIESVTEHHGWVGEGVAGALAAKGFIYFEWFETTPLTKHLPNCDPHTCVLCKRLWTIRLTPKAIHWLYTRSELDPWGADCPCDYCDAHALESNGYSSPGWRNNPNNPANKPKPVKQVPTMWDRLFKIK